MNNKNLFFTKDMINDLNNYEDDKNFKEVSSKHPNFQNLDTLLVLVKVSKDKVTIEDAKNKIVEAFTPYIKTISKSIYINGFDFNDLTSVGQLTVLKCIDAFNPSQGAFDHYTKRAIRLNFHSLIRKNAKHNQTTSLSKPIGDELTIEDTILDNTNIEEDFILKCSKKELWNFISSLEQLEKAIITKCILDKSLTLKDLSLATQMNYRRILRKKDKLLKKLANHFNKAY